MKKKILTICLVVALAATAVIGGTLAYFTDTESDKNEFVTGNISIDQFEMQRDEEGKLEDFEDGGLIMPAAGDPAYNGAYVSYEDVGAPGNNEVWANHMNAQDKFVFVKNDGSQPAYYRTIIAIECPEGVTARTNVNGHSFFDWDSTVTGSQNGNQAKEYIVTVDGVRYEVTVATYTEVLAANEVSRPTLLQVAYDKATTQEQMNLFGDKIEVYAFTQAVQAEGFADLYTADVACEALNDAFGEITDAYLLTELTKVING